ncbi:Alpha/Beta hydrolase protein [Aspergillus nidulans var. acristatus]
MLAATIVFYSLLFPSLGWTMLTADTYLECQDIPVEILTWSTLFSEYSAAATCAANFNSQGSKVICDPGVCPSLEQIDTTIITGFMGHNPGNVTGFLAVDKTNDLIVLSFRGSRTLGNWITDSEYEQVPINGICPGCYVHHGYYYAWGNFSQYIMLSINQVAAQYPHYRIIFTGHSFGGALATLGAVLEGTANRPISLYTFGCPQLGNYNFAEFVTGSTVGNGYRVTHSDDPVPRIFSTTANINKTWQYSTTSPEFWITSGNDVPVTASDIQVIWGIDNKNGNLGTTGLDLAAHNWYIGNMSGCSTN